MVDIYETLREYSQNVVIYDPWANPDLVEHEYGITSENGSLESLKGKFDAVILAVAHKEFLDVNVRDFLEDASGVVYDVKGLLPRGQIDGRL